MARRDQAVERLLGRIDYERTSAMPTPAAAMKLDRMRELLELLGNPQDKLEIVHVAGTKGKGSTSAMIAAVLTASGRRTGLFTSPHLESVEQRITVDGTPCSPADLVSLVEQVWPAVEAMDRHGAGEGPTFFEITTAMALVYFVAQKTDAVVLEVGMGGRLDSTNVCTPRVSVITCISFDHTKQLGETLGQIAAEKAGIIKPGVPVISGVVPEQPRDVIRDIAAERGAALAELQRDFHYAYHLPELRSAEPAFGTLDFSSQQTGQPMQLNQVQLGLLGRHQAMNAAVALATLVELERQGWTLPEMALRKGLAACRLPARIELMSRKPTVVVDAAHNVASAAALVTTLCESFPEKRRTLVLACTKEKDVAGMLAVLVPHFERLIITQYQNNPRSVPVEQLDHLAAAAGHTSRVVFNDTTAAWDYVRRTTTAEELVCVTGSFFIAAELRPIIASQPIPASCSPTLEVA